jgi:hypothetical protein
VQTVVVAVATIRKANKIAQRIVMNFDVRSLLTFSNTFHFCNIGGFHSGGCEVYHLMGYDAV